MTRWLLVLGFGFGGGCSFALTGPDAKAPKSKAPSCDTSKTLVVLDMVAATIAGVAALAAGGNHGTDALAPALIGGLFVGSAIHGNSVVQDCRRANDEYLARANPTSRPPAIAEEADDDDRPPPRVPTATTAAAPEPAQPEPPQAPAQAPQQASQPPPQAPKPVPPPIEVWVDFWKEIR